MPYKTYTEYRVDPGEILIQDEYGKEIGINIPSPFCISVNTRSGPTYHPNWEEVLHRVRRKSLNQASFSSLSDLVSLEKEISVKIKKMAKKITLEIGNCATCEKKRLKIWGEDIKNDSL